MSRTRPAVRVPSDAGDGSTTRTRVSVIVPTKNAARFLDLCLASIKSQARG